jgi:hypothetical protein
VSSIKRIPSSPDDRYTPPQSFSHRPLSAVLNHQKEKKERGDPFFYSPTNKPTKEIETPNLPED